MQADRIQEVNERTIEQGKALEQLKGQNIVILKTMKNVEHHVEGNAKPGILTRLALLEGKQKLMWGLVTALSLLFAGAAVKHYFG